MRYSSVFTFRTDMAEDTDVFDSCLNPHFNLWPKAPIPISTPSRTSTRPTDLLYKKICLSVVLVSSGNTLYEAESA